MTNPTYNPVGFGVGYCGYAACDYECEKDYHWDPQATGNVFQEAKKEKGNCIYNYRYCQDLPTGGLVWTAHYTLIQYHARHLDQNLRPHSDEKKTGNIAQYWDGEKWIPDQVDTTPQIYAGDSTATCTFDCSDPVNTHRDAQRGECIANKHKCDEGYLPENAIWNPG